MTDYVYIDIETVPTQDEAVREEIAATVRPPATMSKAETIAKWEIEQKPTAAAEAVAKTALDGGYGHVVCIGWAIGDGEVSASVLDPKYGGVDHERSYLEAIFTKITAARPFSGRTVIVGHNVAEFDLRFLWQRACVLGVPVPPWFPRDPKPWAENVHDTMAMWAGRNGRISLDRLAKIFGVGGKFDGMTGADVARVWAGGDLARIADYCRQDVEITRAIHRKMLVAMGGAWCGTSATREGRRPQAAEA